MVSTVSLLWRRRFQGFIEVQSMSIDEVGFKSMSMDDVGLKAEEARSKGGKGTGDRDEKHIRSKMAIARKEDIDDAG